jgi:hypothetical protein
MERIENCNRACRASLLVLTVSRWIAVIGLALIVFPALIAGTSQACPEGLGNALHAQRTISIETGVAAAVWTNPADVRDADCCGGVPDDGHASHNHKTCCATCLFAFGTFDVPLAPSPKVSTAPRSPPAELSPYDLTPAFRPPALGLTA